MGRLTTHVLDTMHGMPAAGVKIILHAWDDTNNWRALKAVLTNIDGRTDGNLLSPEDFFIGSYRLEFHIGPYFVSRKIVERDSGFLDIVPVEFNLREPHGNYHVPLLVTPWSYTTYRGS